MCWTTPQECVGYSTIVNCVISSDDCVENVSTHFLNFMYRVCKGTKSEMCKRMENVFMYLHILWRTNDVEKEILSPV